MDKDMLEQFQILIQGMADMEQRLTTKMQEVETKINLKIENEVTKRIDSLFDGYKLVHEKQWELEHEHESMKAQMKELALRLSALENKIA